MRKACGAWLAACCKRLAAAGVVWMGAVAMGQGVPGGPAGFRVREVARFDGNLVRLASDGTGRSLFAMDTGGNVWKIDVSTGAKRSVLSGTDYVNGDASVLGLATDRRGRLYVVANRPDASVEPHLNRVTIFRTTAEKGGLPAEPRAWFETSYPYGVGTFNHGVSKIEVGPDGMVYVSSGSRTDHGEAGREPHRSREGEVPMTGCIWRLDPGSERPQAEIWASGVRNAFGFCWDGAGRMWATENGPNADAPEELNRVEEGKHYGFPYRFSDLGHAVYPDEPAVPAGLRIEPPVVNDGPAGGGSTARPLSTFDPHSSPSGIVWVKDWGGAYRDGFLVARFGNLIGPRDVGFDLLWVKVKGESRGRTHAAVTAFMTGVGRVTDLLKVGEKVYVCVYDTQTTNTGADQVTGHGARILEIGR